MLALRLWSIHPRYLDSKGLVACWREGLLAQHVLLGNTKGYLNHPQLHRFKASTDPVGYIGSYLKAIADEADARNYSFQSSKIASSSDGPCLPVTHAQLDYEWRHFLQKIRSRDTPRFTEFHVIKTPDPHPLFTVIEGGIESWEIQNGITSLRHSLKKSTTPTSASES